MREPALSEQYSKMQAQALKIPNISFVNIGGNISETNNPLSIAESMINEGKFLRVKYVSVPNNAGLSQYAPISYALYELRQFNDTITIITISYLNANIYTNGRSKEGAWCGWKRYTV